MQVLVSKYAGFCPGVKRAVKLTLQHGEGKPGRVATFGPLVHNAQMIEHLAAKGIRTLDSVADAPEEIIKPLAKTLLMLLVPLLAKYILSSIPWTIAA